MHVPRASHVHDVLFCTQYSSILVYDLLTKKCSYTIFICGLSAIDDEFTRPGIEYFLFCFFDKVNPFEDWSLSDP